MDKEKEFEKNKLLAKGDTLGDVFSELFDNLLAKIAIITGVIALGIGIFLYVDILDEVNVSGIDKFQQGLGIFLMAIGALGVLIFIVMALFNIGKSLSSKFSRSSLNHKQKAKKNNDSIKQFILNKDKEVAQIEDLLAENQEIRRRNNM